MTHLAHRQVDVALLVTLVQLTFSRVLVIPTIMKLCACVLCLCVCVCVCVCVYESTSASVCM